MRVLEHPFERKSVAGLSDPGVYVFSSAPPAEIEPHIADGAKLFARLMDGSFVLYVGKAKCLGNRLRTYCKQGSAAAGDWHKANKLNAEARSVVVIPCPSHFEACLLEVLLIRVLSPHLNFMSTGTGKIHYIQEDLSTGELVVSSKRREHSKSWGFIRQRSTVEFAFDALSQVLEGFDHTLGDVALNPLVGTHAGTSRRKRLHLFIEREKRDVARHFLRGKKSILLGALWRKMKEAALNQQFHHAAQLRDLFFAMRHFQHQLKRSRRIARKLKNAQFTLGDSKMNTHRSYVLRRFSLDHIAQGEGSFLPEHHPVFLGLLSSSLQTFRNEFVCKNDHERLKLNFEFLRLMLWWHDNMPEPCELGPAKTGF